MCFCKYIFNVVDRVARNIIPNISFKLEYQINPLGQDNKNKNDIQESSYMYDQDRIIFLFPRNLDEFSTYCALRANVNLGYAVS